MLSAKRKSDGKTVIAKLESKANAPFFCLECEKEVVLRKGTVRVNHFAHRVPDSCRYGTGETEEHRRCKLEIYEALLRHPRATNVALERSLTTARPDVSAYINNVPVAIEVQISTLTQEKIIQRTAEYARKGIYVLWLLQWTPYLDGDRYSPKLWEKWLHATYFGNIYYWIKGLSVACYHFDAHHAWIPKSSWYSKSGKEIIAGGYSRKSKRYRMPTRGETLNLATDFVPRNRDRWEGGGLTIPDAKLFIHRKRQ
jgi:competence protein CoiA